MTRLLWWCLLLWAVTADVSQVDAGVIDRDEEEANIEVGNADTAQGVKIGSMKEVRGDREEEEDPVEQVEKPKDKEEKREEEEDAEDGGEDKKLDDDGVEKLDQAENKAEEVVKEAEVDENKAAEEEEKTWYGNKADVVKKQDEEEEEESAKVVKNHGDDGKADEFDKADKVEEGEKKEEGKDTQVENKVEEGKSAQGEDKIEEGKDTHVDDEKKAGEGKDTQVEKNGEESKGADKIDEGTHVDDEKKAEEDKDTQVEKNVEKAVEVGEKSVEEGKGAQGDDEKKVEEGKDTQAENKVEVSKDIQDEKKVEGKDPQVHESEKKVEKGTDTQVNNKQKEGKDAEVHEKSEETGKNAQVDGVQADVKDENNGEQRKPDSTGEEGTDIKTVEEVGKKVDAVQHEGAPEDGRKEVAAVAEAVVGAVQQSKERVVAQVAASTVDAGKESVITEGEHNTENAVVKESHKDETKKTEHVPEHARQVAIGEVVPKEAAIPEQAKSNDTNKAHQEESTATNNEPKADAQAEAVENHVNNPTEKRANGVQEGLKEEHHKEDVQGEKQDGQVEQKNEKVDGKDGVKVEAQLGGDAATEHVSVKDEKKPQVRSDIVEQKGTTQVGGDQHIEGTVQSGENSQNPEADDNTHHPEGVTEGVTALEKNAVVGAVEKGAAAETGQVVAQPGETQVQHEGQTADATKEAQDKPVATNDGKVEVQSVHTAGEVKPEGGDPQSEGAHAKEDTPKENLAEKMDHLQEIADTSNKQTGDHAAGTIAPQQGIEAQPTNAPAGETVRVDESLLATDVSKVKQDNSVVEEKDVGVTDESPVRPHAAPDLADEGEGQKNVPVEEAKQTDAPDIVQAAAGGDTKGLEDGGKESDEPPVRPHAAPDREEADESTEAKGTDPPVPPRTAESAAGDDTKDAEDDAKESDELPVRLHAAPDDTVEDAGGAKEGVDEEKQEDGVKDEDEEKQSDEPPVRPHVADTTNEGEEDDKQIDELPIRPHVARDATDQEEDTAGADQDAQNAGDKQLHGVADDHNEDTEVVVEDTSKDGAEIKDDDDEAKNNVVKALHPERVDVSAQLERELQAARDAAEEGRRAAEDGRRSAQEARRAAEKTQQATDLWEEQQQREAESADQAEAKKQEAQVGHRLLDPVKIVELPKVAVDPTPSADRPVGGILSQTPTLAVLLGAGACFWIGMCCVKGRHKREVAKRKRQDIDTRLQLERLAAMDRV